jgi:phage shock protein PspC (stress-responsive transcriptional regulator)
MKKTISIHLMGTNFLVEEDAYELVHNYLERLKASLKNAADSHEIIEDVELRIAELATNNLSDKKQVVTLEEMKTILATLGQPEEFLDESGTTYDSSESDSSARIERRLFRDADNGVIGGVCLGLAAYFKIDVVLVRVLVVLLGLLGGFVIPLYIILWIVIPSAKTNIDRLQMQGRPINLENLKEEFEDATQRFSKSTKNFERELRDKESPVRKRLHQFARGISRFFGTILLVFGCILFVFFSILIFSDFSFLPVELDGQSLRYAQFSEIIFVDDSNASYMLLGTIVAGYSIIFSILFSGTTLLFRITGPWKKRINLGLILTGIIGFSICAFQGARLGSDFAIYNEYEQKIGDFSDSVLVATIATPPVSDLVKATNFDDFEDFDHTVFDIKNGVVTQSGIDVNFAVSPDSNFHVYSEYSARGRTSTIALNRSRGVQYATKMEGNTLNLAPVFTFSKMDKLRDQSVRITIQIPRNKVLNINNYLVTEATIFSEGYINEQGVYEHDTYMKD